MRSLQGHLYQITRACSLYKDDYAEHELAFLDEGAIVLMVEPSDPHRRHPKHKVVSGDLIGWVDLEQEEFQTIKETTDAEG